MGLLTGLAIASAVGSGLGSLGNTVLNQYNADKTRQFNREEAEKNRTFQREMAQNNIKYAVNQANQLGISPSLVLGSQSNALGGSQASVGNPASADFSEIGTGIGKLASVLQEKARLNSNEEMNEDRLQVMKEMNDNKLQTMKEMNKDRLEAMKDIQKMKNSVTNDFTKYENKRNHTKKELNKIFTNLDEVELD